MTTRLKFVHYSHSHFRPFRQMNLYRIYIVMPCIIKGCKNPPHFNFKHIKPSQYCDVHKTDKMVRIGTHICESGDCIKRATFGDKNEIPKRCYDHKEPWHIDVVHKLCEEDGCIDRAYKCEINKKTPTYCYKHAPKNYINPSAKKCGIDGCPTTPSYNVPGERAGLTCYTHKQPEYVNVVSNKCTDPNCPKQAKYGPAIDNVALTCRSHGDPSYVIIGGKTCIDETCIKQPIYGLLTDKKTLTCKKHKKDNYVNVMDKYCDKCPEDNPTLANFGSPVDKKLIRCITHKDPEHINLKKKPGCYKENCTVKQAEFGYLGYSPTSCAKHKLDGMTRGSIKRCACKIKATKSKDKLFFCGNCAPKDASDIHQVCSICFTIVPIDEKICEPCNKAIKTGNTLKGHLKELELKTFLEQKNINIYSHDKALGESKKRPDFVIKISDENYIIIECDEFQHSKSYPCECEIVRSKQIFFDIFKSGTENRLLFVRYNPDKYEKVEEKYYYIKERLEYMYNYIKNYDFDNYSYGIVTKYMFYDKFIDDENDFDFIDPYTIST
jgi:hypothetical protein